jgi:hypothetical protein
MSMKVSDHGPYSNEINAHGGTKSLLESGSKVEPSLVGALIEGIRKGDQLIVVPRQQPYLVSGEL